MHGDAYRMTEQMLYTTQQHTNADTNCVVSVGSALGDFHFAIPFLSLALSVSTNFAGTRWNFGLVWSIAFSSISLMIYVVAVAAVADECEIRFWAASKPFQAY